MYCTVEYYNTIQYTTVPRELCTVQYHTQYSSVAGFGASLSKATKKVSFLEKQSAIRVHIEWPPDSKIQVWKTEIKWHLCQNYRHGNLTLNIHFPSNTLLGWRYGEIYVVTKHVEKQHLNNKTMCQNTLKSIELYGSCTQWLHSFTHVHTGIPRFNNSLKVTRESAVALSTYVGMAWKWCRSNRNII